MNLLDRLICEFDRGLRTILASPQAARPSPAQTLSGAVPAEDREAAIRLMRIDHCGEVCAQALYQGQALVARSPEIRTVLQNASREEQDHLAWCEQRLNDLGGRKSLFNPFWYAGSFGLGLVSGTLGDKWSMAFLVETERQVERHIDDHLQRLPASDVKSRRVLEVMREDEIRHGDSGEKHGAATLPPPIKAAMRLMSRVMTRSTYWI
jgi:ubiquinone biosynthesis monooxygenase Coq7